MKYILKLHMNLKNDCNGTLKNINGYNLNQTFRNESNFAIK